MLVTCQVYLPAVTAVVGNGMERQDILRTLVECVSDQREMLTFTYSTKATEKADRHGKKTGKQNRK
jgi:hypothetical protein